MNVEDSKKLNTDENRMLKFNGIGGVEQVSSKYVRQFFSIREAKDLVDRVQTNSLTNNEEKLLTYLGLGEVISSLKQPKQNIVEPIIKV